MRGANRWGVRRFHRKLFERVSSRSFRLSSSQSGGSRVPWKIERDLLWAVLAVFLTLSLTWAAFPKIYDHYHPPKSSPGTGWDPSRIDNWGPSPAQIALSYGCLLWGLGFFQLKCARWFKRESSAILFWLFILLASGVAAAGWAFSIACRFWTISTSLEFRQAEAVIPAARLVFRYCFAGAMVLGFLNIAYASVLGRRTKDLSV